MEQILLILLIQSPLLLGFWNLRKQNEELKVLVNDLIIQKIKPIENQPNIIEVLDDNIEVTSDIQQDVINEDQINPLVDIWKKYLKNTNDEILTDLNHKSEPIPPDIIILKEIRDLMRKQVAKPQKI
jgi:hypothetical protein